MKLSSKEKLDKLAKDDINKKIFMYSSIAIGLILLLVLYSKNIDSYHSILITGKANKITVEKTEQGSDIVMLVQLKNGNIVRANMDRKVPLQQEAVVEIEKIVNKNGMLRHYNFIRYMSE